jgi:hypothetical protein
MLLKTQLQGGHTMRAHPQNSDTAKRTLSIGILNKNESCKANRIDLKLISFAKKMSLLLVLIFQMPWHKSSLSPKCDFYSGYCVHPVTEIEKLSIKLIVSHSWKLFYCRIRFINKFSIFVIFPMYEKCLKTNFLQEINIIWYCVHSQNFKILRTHLCVIILPTLFCK